MENKELNREELKLIADAALLIGRSMLESGAEIYIVEESLSVLVRAFGCEKLNLSVLSHTISMTLGSGNEFRTKIIRIGAISPNMQRLSELYRLSNNVWLWGSPVDVLKQTKHLLSQNQQFGGLQKSFFAALACAAFAALFQGTVVEIGSTFMAAFLAASLKTVLDSKEFNPLLTITAASLSATVCIGLLVSWGGLEENTVALASSVLFLVPGVPLINSFEDIIKGYYLSGLARGLHGILVAFAIVFGFVIGLKLVGSSV